MLSAKILGPLRPAPRCLAARQVYLLAAVSLYLNLKTISLHRTKPSSALSILSDCAAAHRRFCTLNKQRKRQIILITGYQNLARNWIFDPKSGVNGPKGSSWNSFPINNVDIKWPRRIAIAAAGFKAAARALLQAVWSGRGDEMMPEQSWCLIQSKSQIF